MSRTYRGNEERKRAERERRRSRKAPRGAWTWTAALAVARALVVVAILASAHPDTVRVTAHGARFHSIGCPALKGAPGALVRWGAADSAGYVACRRCIARPPAKASRFARVTGAR